MGDKHGKNTFLRWAARTSAKYTKSARRRLGKRKLGTGNWVLEDTAPAKAPPRWWRQVAMNIFQGNKCCPGKRVFKGGNSIKREKTDSISSTTSDPRYALQPEVSSSELDATSDS